MAIKDYYVQEAASNTWVRRTSEKLEFLELRDQGHPGEDRTREGLISRCWNNGEIQMQLLPEIYRKQREEGKYPDFFLSVPLLHHLATSPMDQVLTEADKEPREKKMSAGVNLPITQNGVSESKEYI